MLRKIRNIILLILFLINAVNAEMKINAQDGSTDDRYGQSVSISDELFFVGANRDFNNGVNSGSVYIYTYNDMSCKCNFMSFI